MSDQSTKGGNSANKQDKKARLAAELRANLRKRKAKMQAPKEQGAKSTNPEK